MQIVTMYLQLNQYAIRQFLFVNDDHAVFLIPDRKRNRTNTLIFEVNSESREFFHGVSIRPT